MARKAKNDKAKSERILQHRIRKTYYFFKKHKLKKFLVFIGIAG